MYTVLYKYPDESGADVFLFTPGSEQSNEDVEKLVLNWIEKKQTKGLTGEFTLIGIVQPEW